jgi:hypothetical protein
LTEEENRAKLAEKNLSDRIGVKANETAQTAATGVYAYVDSEIAKVE